MLAGLTSSHRQRTPSEVRRRGEIRYGLRPARLPPRALRLIREVEEPAIDLPLSLPGRHTDGVHPRIDIGSAEWVRFRSARTAHRLIGSCAPHLAALVREALATGCRASEITELEWDRVDLARNTAWLNRTKNGTPRGAPLNADAVEVLREQIGKLPCFCFT